MSSSYTSLLTHIVFSTKHRYPFMTTELRSRLLPYIGGIVRQIGGKALIVGGGADHIHILVSLPSRLALSDVVRTIKSNSSRWIHEEFGDLNKFAWQTGYGAFSVSRWDQDMIIGYIRKQEEHHRVKTYQEEVIEMLKDYDIEHDERYLWD